jgi:hypothetical protein
MKVVDKITRREYDPLRAIEWVIAVFTFSGGLFIFTPLYQVSKAITGPTALATTLSHPIMILFWGSLLLVGALLVMFGLLKNMPQFKSAGWFSIILARVFQLITTFIVAGPLPITWIYPMTLVSVVIILWIVARVQVYNDSP